MEAKPYKIPMPFKKLNKELIDKLLKDIAAGSPHRYAAEANGITETIFNIWRNQGKIDLAYGKEDSLPAQLVVSLGEIKQKKIISYLKKIDSSPKGHKGAEWVLEHAYWRDFGANAQNRENDERITALEEQQQLLNKDENNGEIKSKDSK